jgi:hypothetical protein
VSFGTSRSLSARAHQRDPEKAPPCVKSHRLSHHACFCDPRFDRHAMPRKIYKNITLKKLPKEKESRSRYISRVHGGRPHPTDCNGSSHIGFVTNVLDLAKFDGGRLKGLVSAKDRI